MTESDFQMFEVVGALVVVLDVDGRIVYWNRSCSNLTGYSLEEVRGRKLWDCVLAPAEVESVRTVFATLRTAPPPNALANHWVTKTGERRWLAWSHTLTRNPDGQIQYIIKTGIDRTERKELTEKVEAALKRAEASERELRVAAEFREMFIGILGHDLRTPIGAIRLSAETLLLHGHLDDRDRRAAARIISSGDRVTRMIFQLLELTRARVGGGFPLEPKPTDLGEVCRSVAEEFGPALQLEVEGNLTGVWDPDRLAEALSNIARNAIEHAAPETGVVVKAHPEGAEVVVEVINHGEPIPADVLPFIFEPFRRAQQHKSSTTGNLGLGLYIANQIVSSGGGKLVAYSTDGTTTFVMRLPRNAPAASPPLSPSEARAGDETIVEPH